MSAHEKSCLKKRAYTQEQAIHVLKRMVRRTGSTRLTAYKCKFCEHWHVGHIKLT